MAQLGRINHASQPCLIGEVLYYMTHVKYVEPRAYRDASYTQTADLNKEGRREKPLWMKIMNIPKTQEHAALQTLS